MCLVLCNSMPLFIHLILMCSYWGSAQSRYSLMWQCDIQNKPGVAVNCCANLSLMTSARKVSNVLDIQFFSSI